MVIVQVLQEWCKHSIMVYNKHIMTKIQKILTIGKTVQDVFLKRITGPHTEARKFTRKCQFGLKMEVEDVTFSTGGNALALLLLLLDFPLGLHVSYMWTLSLDPASESILHEV